MKININEIILFFDELMPLLTDEDLKIYWFNSVREDGLIIKLVISVYESRACVIINNKEGIDIASVSVNYLALKGAA